MYLYYLLGQKTFRSNTAYRAAHVVDSFGSAIFGFIMIFIWKAATVTSGGLGPYSTEALMLWVAFGQTLFPLAFGMAEGLNIQQAVRTGSISIEFLRPMNYFSYVLSREMGQQLYQFVYRSMPIFVIFAVTIGYRVPSMAALLLLIPSCLLSMYVGLCLTYLVGISSFWTVDIRGAHYIHFALSTAISGMQIPADLLPGILGRIAPYTPWASLAHYPCLVYLEIKGLSALTIQVFWALTLTLLCLFVTKVARRALEVQGG